jgi:pyruvate, water dikinase
MLISFFIRGGRTCHAAIISRELGIPCLVGCESATLHVKSGQVVTVDTSVGEIGHVYNGEIPFHVSEINLSTIPATKTKVALLLGNPSLAFPHSFLPNDGCGLARMEFLVSSWIKCHPMALLHPEQITQAERDEIRNAIGRGTGPLTPEIGREFFVNRLAEGISMLAAAFYPKPCILRFSDFKTDEYANLLGGKIFEPLEDNPMLGWRGASRYYDPKYAPGFAMECAAVKKVREEIGLTNLWIMVPFVRTVKELEAVIEELRKNGLVRGENGLAVIMMCEIPANAILAKEFLKHVDGFSIGSNDLTQLTLGIDRNSAVLAPKYDNERNEAVKALISMSIKACRDLDKYCGLCGQAPSDYPEFSEFLVREGITSISVQPDSIIPTKMIVAKIEAELATAAKK